MKKKKPQVAVVRSSDPRDVRACVEQVPFKAKRRDRVVVKINLCSPLELTGVTNTRAETVDEVVRILREQGIKPVIAEGCGFPNDTRMAFLFNRIYPIAKRYGLELVDLNRDEGVEIGVKKPLVLEKIRIARTVVEADYIISVCKLKTHFYTKVTLSLKNMMGALPWVNKHRMHHDFNHRLDGASFMKAAREMFTLESDREYTSKAVADLCSVITPHYAVIDGATAMEGSGPTYGRPKKANLIISGNDPLAADAVATYLMGFDPADVLLLRMAHGKGIGEMNLKKIKIHCDDNIEDLRLSFTDARVDDRIMSWLSHIGSVPFNRISHRIFKI
ncbi:MAG: DUF362 domain-containing protein [bacterium]